MAKNAETITIMPGQTGFALQRGPKPLMTPAGRPLLVPTIALAQAMADEWRGSVMTGAMAITPLVQTVLDQVTPRRPAVITALGALLATETLCYRSPDPAIAAAQRDQWDPWLEWFATTSGITLPVTDGLAVPELPLATGQRWQALLDGLDDWALGSISIACGVLDSPVLALALWQDACSTETAAELAALELTLQAQRWGEDRDQARRQQHIRNELAQLSRLRILLGRVGD